MEPTRAGILYEWPYSGLIFNWTLSIPIDRLAVTGFFSWRVGLHHAANQVVGKKSYSHEYRPSSDSLTKWEMGAKGSCLNRRGFITPFNFPRDSEMAPEDGTFSPISVDAGPMLLDKARLDWTRNHEKMCMKLAALRK
jgi:hypothetical protein